MASDFFDSIRLLAPLLEATGPSTKSFVVYGGEAQQRRSDVTVLPWSSIASTRWD